MTIAKTKSGVYKITSPNGKIYVGSSRNLDKRIEKYRNIRDIRQPLLKESLKTYGFENHVLEIIEKDLNEKELHKSERKHGVEFDVLGINGLNCILPSDGENPSLYREELILKFSSRKHTLETRKKMSEKKTGILHPNSTEVVHLPSGKVYGSVREAAETHGLNQFTLARWLRSGRKMHFQYKEPQT
jgi:group I intron endonuclease